MAYLEDIEHQQPQGLIALGDTHGMHSTLMSVSNMVSVYRKMLRIDKKETIPIIQVGDFGYWPGIKRYDIWMSNLDSLLSEDYINAKLWFLDGNHENHYALSQLADTSHRGEYGDVYVTPNISWLPRGIQWQWTDTVMTAFGGAVSIDRDARRLGYDWFREESITYGQYLNFTADPRDTDILFTHDTPSMDAQWLQRALRSSPISDQLNEECTENRKMLQAIADHCTPQLVIHGHWHYRVTYETMTETRSARFHTEALASDESPAYMSCWVTLPDMKIADTKDTYFRQ